MPRGRERTSDPVDMDRLRRLTIDINEGFLKAVPISPKYPDQTLHHDQIYTELSLRENIFIHQRSYIRDPKLPQYVPIKVPEDLFYCKNGTELARRIHIDAPAGYGKTVFCQYLVSCWCKAKKATSLKDLTIWERGVGKFDFVFYIPMERVDGNRSMMQDILRSDIFTDYPEMYDTIDEAFTNDSYSILIIMDGLDAWKFSDQVRRYLRFKGIPDFESMSRTVMLYTYRPWVSEYMHYDLDWYNKIIEIVGLCFDGPSILMEKILTHCFNVKEDDIGEDPKAEMLRSISKHLKTKSLMHIPLFTNAFVYSSYETSHVEESLAKFISTMVELLIEAARRRNEIGDTIDTSENREKDYESKDFQIPRFVKENKELSMGIYAFSRIGKQIFNCLITKVTRHCFERSAVSRLIGSAEKKFLFRTGLMNRLDGPVSVITVMSEITFIHRYIQDFFVALHIVCEKSEALPKLTEHLSSLENILEFGNILKVIAGIDPPVSNKMSRHIVDILNNECETTAYRQDFGDSGRRETVRKVYELLCECYWEAKTRTAMDSAQKEKIEFHVEDMVLDGLSPAPVLRATADLLIRRRKEISSLNMECIPDALPGLSSQELTTFVDGASSLQSLRITDRNIQQISNKFSSLSILVLRFVHLSPEASVSLQGALKVCSNLRCVTLDTVMNDRSPLEVSLKANKKLSKLTLAYMYCKSVKVSAKHLEHLTLEQLTGSTMELLQNLPACSHLTTLGFSYTKNSLDTKKLLEVLPSLKNLRRVLYDGTLQGQSERQYHAVMVRTILLLPRLASMELRNTDIDDDALILAPNISQLTRIRLGCVNMTERGWTDFVTSLLAMRLDVSVVFSQTNIDDGNLERIDECNQVVMDVYEGRERLEFTKFSSHKGIYNH